MCFGGSAMWREWRVIGLPRESMRVYVLVVHSVGRTRKRWIDTVNECLRKRGLDVSQPKRMVQDRCEWRRFVRGNAWCISRE